MSAVVHKRSLLFLSLCDFPLSLPLIRAPGQLCISVWQVYHQTISQLHFRPCRVNRSIWTENCQITYLMHAWCSKHSTWKARQCWDPGQVYQQSVTASGSDPAITHPAIWFLPSPTCQTPWWHRKERIINQISAWQNHSIRGSTDKYKNTSSVSLKVVSSFTSGKIDWDTSDHWLYFGCGV